MLNKFTNYLNLLFIIIIIFITFISLKPNNTQHKTIIGDDFQIHNAISHVNKITQAPHFVGSTGHEEVGQYIVNQLRSLGLQTEIQEANITNNKNTYIRVKNIIARIKGSNSSSKSLLIMSHYDSVPYASLGAGDAASGVAVILEGIRAFLEQKIIPNNDIIILISDAEELGLLGAQAFVNKHRWAENVGAVLNFEARGTAGSSYMLMETNSGNHNLLGNYKAANSHYPNSNSLSYSIYKMLPNDTDLTVFRRDKDIVGFNFAYIGDHFNYHTVLDNVDNLSLDSLAHQAHYLMPMLSQLSQIDLTQLKSKQDDVYFQIPFWKTINYPFSYTLTMSIVNLIFLILVVVYGLKKKSLTIKSIISSSFPLFKALTTTALLCFVILKFLYWLHPHYNEILHGFTYNGYWYIAFFSFLTIAITYFFYKDKNKSINLGNALVVPVLIWIFIDTSMALFLTGAHFFIIIGFSGTLIILSQIINNKYHSFLTLLLSIPALLVFSPIFMQFPVALGLAIIPFSCLLLVLFVSVFISNINHPETAKLTKWIFIIPLITIYIMAETKSSYTKDRPLPDSLFYFQDQNSQSAFMFTRDNKTDNWNKSFFEEQRLGQKELDSFKQDHWRRAKIVATTKNRNIPVANVELLNDTLQSESGTHVYQFKLTPQRNSHVLILRTNTEITLSKLAINNESITVDATNKVRKGFQIARIFNANESHFIIDIEIATDQTLDLSLIEMSPDLLKSDYFDIPKRTEEFIPKPFIYTDSIITKQNIKF